MCKRARLSIHLDGGWPDLATGKCPTHLFNDADTTHSLEKKKKAKETFIRSWKDKKLKVKLLLQFTVKDLLIYNDFSTPFSFGYNMYIITL